MPRWRATRWLADAGPNVPDDIRAAMVQSLFATLPIFFGGVLNSIAVAAIVAVRVPHADVQLWLALEIMLGAVRLAVLRWSFHRADQGKSTPTDLYLILGVCWAASVGYGATVSVLSGDWVAATLACMSAAGMVGGICFRNFAAPRLCAVMIVLSLGPIPLAAPFTGEVAMLLTVLQVPFYAISMCIAAFKLKGLMVTTMQAEREHEHQARHDILTGLSNRAGLMRAIDGAPGAFREPLALLYLDLDGFKAVNDSYGHARGDKLLTIAAERLKGLLRMGDVAARIGGDEFVVIARGVEKVHATALAERLIREISAVYDLGDGVKAHVGVSVGVALVPDHGDVIPALLDTADAALYQAKVAGKSRCVVAPPRGAPGPGDGGRSSAAPA
ncbi:diguanylate cyclase, partial [Methylopila musalis]